MSTGIQIAYFSGAETSLNFNSAQVQRFLKWFGQIRLYSEIMLPNCMSPKFRICFKR